MSGARGRGRGRVRGRGRSRAASGHPHPYSAVRKGSVASCMEALAATSSNRLVAASASAGAIIARNHETGVLLSNAAYAVSTVNRYDRAVEQFCDYVRLLGIGIRCVSDLDSALASYCAFLYDQGYAPAAGNKTVAGLQRLQPHLNGSFVRTSVVIRGWTKLMPSVKRHPLTRQITRSIALLCLRWGRVHMAVAYLLGFHCLLRISEIRNLCLDDIALAGDARFDNSNRSVVLRIKVAKTGVNQSVTVTDPFVMECLQLVIGDRDLRSSDKLFAFSEWEFRTGIRMASAVLGLADHFTPHSLRHGGCTYLYSVELMDPARIMVRGRWSSQRSFTHYLQEHAAALVNLRISKTAEFVGRLVDAHPVSVFKLALSGAPASAPQVATALRVWDSVFGP